VFNDQEIPDDQVVCHYRGIKKGRPFLNEKRSYSTAKRPINPDFDWSVASSVETTHLSKCSPLRKWLSTQWETDGLAEHASIGSFARHLLELLAVGAPSALIADVQRATGDEIIHARICFSLASLYRGSPVEPGAFPIKSSVEVRTDITSMAVGTAIEGCVEETLSAVCA